MFLENQILNCVIGASLAEIITLPICTTKTWYQTTNYNNYLKVVKHIYSKSGVLGFYRASVPAVSLQIITSAYKMSFFNYLNKRFPNKDIGVIIAYGILSSVSCVLFTHPIDYCRIVMQVHKPLVLREMYTGVTPALMKNSLAGMLYLPMRHILKQQFPHEASWKIGLVSAIISTIIVHPFDYFKTILISRNNGISFPYSNPYRGLLVNLLRIVPHFIIMTEVSEKLNK